MEVKGRTGVIPARLQVLSGRYDALEEPLVFSVFGKKREPALIRLPLAEETSPEEPTDASQPYIPTVTAEYRGCAWTFEREQVRVDLNILLFIVLRPKRGRYSLIPVYHRCRWERPWRDLLTDREAVVDPARWDGQARVGAIRCQVQGWQQREGCLEIRLFAVGPVSLKLYEWREVGLGASMVLAPASSPKGRLPHTMG
ncbi:hypothetical protein HM1_0735 [Heliomicrobium modesticaldum Ice1]|uniref:Uncharacterized protein n=1 Tax=Heliobacterium modesticaldum (strain ATCC 51547 / Ice1) TaxID=498761 RepID=B0TB93_HELMI|nr:hypothetical protein [Heliomicrobium modesticaldum]ABZ83820.1 hypothetical protein HM1_0735 [Heliomicrobium modesticaldum Ice1]